MEIKFNSDNIKTGAKRVDGSISVILDVGEYERHKLRDIYLVPDDSILEVSIKVQEDAES